jgi:hypothetical protein
MSGKVLNLGVATVPVNRCRATGRIHLRGGGRFGVGPFPELADTEKFNPLFVAFGPRPFYVLVNPVLEHIRDLLVI